MSTTTPPTKRWYRWTLNVDRKETGYQRSSSALNVQTTIAERFSYRWDGRLEERDVIVKAVKRPSVKWLEAEWSRAVQAGIDAMAYSTLITHELATIRKS